MVGNGALLMTIYLRKHGWKRSFVDDGRYWALDCIMAFGTDYGGGSERNCETFHKSLLSVSFEFSHSIVVLSSLAISLSICLFSSSVALASSQAFFKLKNNTK
ncbi:uncharacterized protein LOC130628784 [Hydractinia symbiolongicarpus]|uniref:uncharacterized protein LOC130628784 n=1 Tax=Hydractinia symbiolongicarpus TaxID=13093 RepID=UPI00254CC49E|nr:uncharacterized protein LOC130628784 [Hydractinia symbiolongicarpus]